ncbi:hypothetical protein AMAG_19949 [Allomyces macrogynus ATCC 38327]|uniref:Isopenicillin N synthase-like Fe(2+) 2OG dioxygenase domain-containing protein n=1 Tax=Allomyces macrogynus (strain ATCC 38327) TaxID=578462 RepID=A0A0L0T3A1_ALLM3|nr:hypothetical protein AMAG_19949 [Allomyces macrogynus ATCC 38327]|eukprot:KNE69044.1 hypothetical protein AMAG_19949 [Allomyces macrogynus ATCC 38327]
MIARYTNRTFHSTLHRVVHAGVNQDRYSIPFFFDMDADVVVRVLPEFMPGGKLANPEVQEVYFPGPIVFEEHLQNMYNSTYGAGKGRSQRRELE